MIPYRISFDTIAGEVLWTDMGASTFDQPMFDQTVQHRLADPDVDPLPATSTDALLVLAASLPPVKPSGFIFHVSRCGSTLLSNALQRMDGVTVISEAGILNMLFQAYLSPAGQSDTHPSPSKIKDLLLSVVKLLGHAQPGKPRLFVKFSSWNVLLLPLIRELWPDVPIAFAFREPFAVVHSLLSGKAGWAAFWNLPAISAALLGIREKEAAALPYIEFVIRLLSAIYQAGSLLPAGTLLIDYADEKTANVHRLLDHFHLTPGEKELEDIQEILDIYSKATDRSTPFGQEAKSPGFLPNERLRRLIKDHLGEPYARLVQSKNTPLD